MKLKAIHLPVFVSLICCAFFSQAQVKPTGQVASTTSSPSFKHVLHKGETRGETKASWLIAKHSFSFNNYYDPERMNFGALRVFNDDWIQANKGFPTHPHSNMEIITVVLKGSMHHKDDFGNEGTIKAGDVQIMSAGTGIKHSESNPSKTEDIESFQIWVFPNKKDVKPRYQQLNGVLKNQANNTFKTIVSPTDSNAVFLYQNAVFTMGMMDAKKKTTHKVAYKGNGVYFFVLEGNAIINGITVNRRDAIGIWDTDNISIEAVSNLKVLLMDVPMN
jgi:quercetin 2,3-dioxygenase